MHEQWKKRKMFSNKEQGIMSGLDPVPMMAGGSVPYPGMETGGLFIPENENVDPSPKGDTLTEETKILNTMYNDIIKTMLETQTPFESIIENRLSQGSLTFKAAEALKKVFAIQKMRQTQKNSYPKDKGIDFFPSGPPTKRDALEYLDREQKMLQPSFPKMEIGGVVPQTQLFEEGDNELNASLNMMASVTNPDVPDMPMTIMDEKVEGKEEATMDQGPDEYKQDVLNLKDKFKQEIMTYMSQGQTPELRDYLMNMNMTYANELEMLKEKHGVEMNDPNDKLMTPDFVEQLMTFAKAPGMEQGGVAPPVNLDLDLDAISTQKELDDLGITYPIQGWLQLDPVGRKTLFNEEMLKKSRSMQEGTGRLEELYKERRGLVDELGTSAGTAYKTKEGGLGGYIGQALAERRGKAAAMDKILADEIASERSVSGTGSYTSPAAVTSSIVLGQDKVIENTYDGYIKAFKDFDNPAGAAVGQLALDGQLPPKSAGPIYRQTVLNDQGIEIDWLTYFRDSVRDLEAAGTPIDGESLATIARTWQLEVLG